MESFLVSPNIISSFLVSITPSLLGLLLRPMNLSPDSQILLAYPGELFMRLLKLFILPLIISSLIVGSSNLNDKMSTKITIRTLFYFAATSLLMATIGTFLALIFQPGSSSIEISHEATIPRKTSSVLDSLMDLGR